MNLNDLIKKVALILSVFIFCLFLVAIRFFISARSEYKIANDYMAKGLTDTAVVHYDLSIRNYFPLSPYVNKSAKMIDKIASDYEGQKKYKESFNTYQILLSALSAVKHPLFFPAIKIETVEQKMDKVKNILKSENK